MTLIILLIAAVFFLSYANGANDNFKGVATLYGSGTLSYRRALFLATLTTLAGSLVSLFFAQNLMKAFSGKGIVPDALAGTPPLLVVVAAASAFTIFLATRSGMPASTTHAIVGALFGIAFVTQRTGINWDAMAHTFFLPLVVSPFLAAGLSFVATLLSQKALSFAGISEEACVCVETCANGKQVQVQSDGTLTLYGSSSLGVKVDTVKNCAVHGEGKITGVSTKKIRDALHVFSAGTVCFSRAVNDTPKIAALLLAASFVNPSMALVWVAAAMLAGGFLSAKKVAETISLRITTLEPQEALCANVTTAFLVLFASNHGLPVSTTHVSCGSIFGAGAARKNVAARTAAGIAAAWLTTLPVAALTSALLFVFARPAFTAEKSFSYAPYANALQAFVTPDGLVRYKALKEKRAGLDAFIKNIEQLHPSVYDGWSENEKIAFWLNAYNAHVLRIIIEHYPIRASFFKSVVFPRNSIQQIPGVFSNLKFTVMGKSMTLDDIEHNTLRKKFNEPRIHMALVCAALSCPPLRTEPFIAEKLDAQLNDQTKKFLANAKKFNVARANRVVYVSSIFKWFGEDFIKTFKPKSGYGKHGAKENSVLHFVSRFVNKNDREFLEKGSFDVQYLKYDWTLNEEREKK